MVKSTSVSLVPLFTNLTKMKLNQGVPSYIVDERRTETLQSGGLATPGDR